jgi:hypothetical protein
VLQQKRDLFADVAVPAASGDTAAGKHRAS